MPSITFERLTAEKKEKILLAAKKEFSRVPLGEASVANIVMDAGIARGSFYQYFESKEDLFDYVFEDIGKFKAFLKEKTASSKIDLFDFHLAIYDYFMNVLQEKDNIEFAKILFKSLKVADVNFFKAGEGFPAKLNSFDFLEKIDNTYLELNHNDLRRLNEAMFFITRGMLARSFSTEDARSEYHQTIQLMKKTFTKKEGR